MPNTSQTMKQIPSLKHYIFPSNEIITAIQELTEYWQFCNQTSVALYEKWKGKDHFKGKFGEYIELEDIKELFHLAEGKEWETLITAIFLIQHHSEEINFKGFEKKSAQHQLEIMEIISKGQKAYQKILKWLSPINKEEILNAIHDGVKVTFGNREYDQFQVLKYAELKSIQNKEEAIVIFPELLEVDDPPALVNYFKTLSEPIKDCLIIAFMRNKQYEFKPTVYLFLIWENNFYVVTMGDKRVNLENTAGARSPDRYIERHFKNIWLPLDIMIDSNKKVTSKDIMVRNQKIFKRGKMSDIFAKSPETKMWLEIFVYRILDWIKKSKDKINQGYIPSDIIKMLEDKTDKKIEERIIVGTIGKTYSSFESQHDASSYLLKKYESKIRSIIPKVDQFPIVIGTKDYIEGVIKYKQRIPIADSLERQIYKDYRENSKKVYNWFKAFVKKRDVSKLVELALQNKLYGYLEYPDFTEHYFGEYPNGKYVKLKKPTMNFVSVIKITDHDDKYQSTWTWGVDPLEIVLSKDGHIYKKSCAICKKFKHKKILSIKFKDYRQLCEFFNISKEKLPKEFVEHFHRQHEVYIGNPILDDTDPMDEICDFWFRDVIHNEVGAYKNTKDYFAHGDPYFNIRIPLCKRCLKKNQKVEKNEMS